MEDVLLAESVKNCSVAMLIQNLASQGFQPKQSYAPKTKYHAIFKGPYQKMMPSRRFLVILGPWSLGPPVLSHCLDSPFFWSEVVNMHVHQNINIS